MRFRFSPLIGLLALTSVNTIAGEVSVSFSKDIQPILQTTCWKCHGSSIQLSKLDLRTRESALKGGEKGSDLVPGKADDSRLYRLVAGVEKPAMPMDGKLTAEQIALIKAWINQGAQWEAGTATGGDSSAQLSSLEDMQISPEARKYWAFQKPVKAPVPVISPDLRNPIDQFLEKARREKGLTVAPRADKLTLVRRAYLDLTGLPPTPDQISAFLADKSPEAWPNLIDQLLDSPHYGECWGRHWLDVARYADSNGYEKDFDRPNAWRYRDYVIRSFNKDTPYNVFLAEQIAGDELDWVTDDSLIATGFLRSFAKVGFREKDNPQFRYEYLDDMIATIGRGVLGLTVQCARCHNHKFDPIPQKDYYKLQASLFTYVETDYPLTSKAQAEAYAKKVAEINAKIAPLKSAIKDVEAPYRERLTQEKYKKFPENIQVAIATPADKRTDGQKLLASQVIRTTSVSSDEIDRVITPEDAARKKALAAQIAAIEKQRPKPIPMASIVTDGDYRFEPEGPGDNEEPGKGVKRENIQGTFLFHGPGRYQAPPSYFLIRGDIESRGSQMKPGFVTVATYGNPPTEDPPANGLTSGRRRALAEWLGSTDNPLTARVIVNRIWHHHFGRGIVATLDNFGKMGDRPSNQELLDWLAVEFMNRGWSIKQMQRLMMNSEAYQMASQFENADDLAKDPDNVLLWRYRIQREDAEMVRDSILAVSGALDQTMGGPPVFPHLPDEVLSSITEGIWKRQADGPASWRRSVYVYRKRILPYPLFEVFDLPDQNISCGRRNVSTVPTQALALLNDDFVLRQAELFANRLNEAAPNDPARQVDLAYRLALARPPDPKELEMGLQFLKTEKLADFAHVMMNLNEFVYIR